MLDLADIQHQLAGPGLRLSVGALTLCIRTPLARIARALSVLYADHMPGDADTFADFHVSVQRAAGLRGWLRPQVEFDFDGQRPFMPLPLPQAFAMLEWGLNWCIAAHCHQYLVVHAASLARGDDALILPAPPGAGKSTLCAALMLRGWRLLSDELTLIDTATGLLHAHPRPVNLKNNSIDVIQHFAPEAIFGPRVPDTQKGTVSHLKPTRQSVLAAHHPARPRWVIFPRYQAGAPLHTEPIGHAACFMRIADNAFNYTALGATGFHTAGRLVDQTRAWALAYSALPEALAFIDTLAA